MDSNHFPKNEKIGFLRKTTLVDFPEHIACAVFLIGCNLRCPYCYNKDLVLINENSQKDTYGLINARNFIGIHIPNLSLERSRSILF